MSNPIVFYSWQSDLPKESTRDLIREATEQAITNAQSDLPVEDSPRLDHDTLGRGGTPAISETIYHKIERSAVFVADVTFIGERAKDVGKKAKKLSNPNVLIELGYAAAKLGWERIVLVVNKHYGTPESLPFDLRNRRFPVTFDLGPNSTRRRDELEALSSRLELSISTCLASDYQRIDDVLSKLSSYSRALMRQNGASSHFWETELDNMVLSRLDLAISQLLDLDVVRCVEFPNERGVGYMWTYLGRQCIKRLGLALPPDSIIPVVEQSPIETRLFSYDQLMSDDGSAYRVDLIERGMPGLHIAPEDVATGTKNTAK